MKTSLPSLCVGLLLSAGTAGAWAQSIRAPSACDRPGVDRVACQQDERAAAREQRRNGLVTPSAEEAARNLRARCEPLPADDRQACLRRMDGQGKLTGSVEQGGVLRELVVVEPPASEPASAPAAAALAATPPVPVTRP